MLKTFDRKFIVTGVCSKWGVGTPASRVWPRQSNQHLSVPRGGDESEGGGEIKDWEVSETRRESTKKNEGVREKKKIREKARGAGRVKISERGDDMKS